MRRFISILTACLGFCLTANAQVSLADVIRNMDGHRVSAEFKCKVTTDITMEYSGTAIAQDNCFAVKANGIEAYCDGKKLLVVDPEAKEAYIESAVGLAEYLKDNINAVSELSFSELRFLDRQDDMSVFSTDTSGLGKDWMVTDLRPE